MPNSPHLTFFPRYSANKPTVSQKIFAVVLLFVVVVAAVAGRHYLKSHRTTQSGKK
tara:strand:- start:450 stop:617 length:168 start_codon:yes stop_codon:yes gene_type:complete